jgi:DNA-binding response OmpR family regulator
MVRTLREARATRDSHITMVLESAEPEDKRRALRAGADDYLVGPLNAERLLERLATYEAKPSAPTAPRGRLTHGELVLDLTQRADAIDKELARLEQIARQKGFAIASASALPLTIERLARWSRTLEQRGLRLVPVSAAVQGGPAAKAQTTGSLR